MSHPNIPQITSGDRERLAVSTAIAIGLYGLLFLVLLGLHWPPTGEVKQLSPPVSLSIQLVGTAPPLEAPLAPPVTPQPTNGSGSASAASVGAPSAASPLSAGGSETSATTVGAAGAAASPAPGTTAATSSSGTASSAETGGQAAGPAPASHPASAPTPYYSTGSVISSGPQGGGASAPSEQQGGGAAQPGINYQVQPGGSPQPAQGGASPGATGGPVTSEAYQGSAAQGPGSSISPSLVEQAGTASTSAGGSTSSVGGSGQSGSGALSAGSGTAPGSSGALQGQAAGGGQGAGAGSAGPAGSGGPGGSSIQWNNQAAQREVTFRPPDPVIPKSELAQLPPLIKVKIIFLVYPNGTVRSLNIDPSTGYPQLDSRLMGWMEKWQFTPATPGTPNARGELPYVIQASTAR